MVKAKPKAKVKHRGKGKRRSQTVAQANWNAQEDLAKVSESFDLIAEADWYAREQRYQQRIQDVKVSVGLVSESIEDYKRLEKLQSKNEQWNRYVNCDGLPNVMSPAELRHFIAEIYNMEEIEEHSVVNWALSINERSILTQDSDAEDRTRDFLIQNFRPDIGKLYDVAVERILICLDRIDLLLSCEFELSELSPDVVIEIILIRGEFSNAINTLFDKLTYRVLCAPSSYKTQYSGITESYCYQSAKYDIQIWWLIDVPLRYKYFEPPMLEAKLNCVDVCVQIPISVLCDNLSLRCIHTHYDLYSENAKSFSQVLDKSANDLNAGFTDIEDCLINEWNMQVSIMNGMISKMEQRMFMYEDIKREIENNYLQTPKADRKAPPIVPQEPEKLPDGHFPDPYKKFLKQEQQDYVDFLDQYLSPTFLHLEPDEINLRRFVILGGIYAITFVHKPKHTDFDTFNQTNHDDKRWLLTNDESPFVEEVKVVDNAFSNRKKGITAPTEQKPTLSNHSSSLIASKSDIERKSSILAKPELQNKNNIDYNDEEVNYFYVIVKLPKHLCRYGEPLACQYLDEYIIEEDSDDDFVDESEEYRMKKKLKKSSPRPTKKTGNVETSQRKLPSKSLEEDEPRHEFARPRQSSIMPKLSVAHNIYRTSFFNSPRSFILRHTILPEVMLHNFPLKKNSLDRVQVNEIKRHCVPRILSSFKLPNEFKMENMEAFSERSKGNKLLRRNQQTLYTDEPEYFSYEKQESPERLYPIFDRREKILYDNSSLDETSSNSDIQVKVVKIDQISEDVKTDDPNEETIYSVLLTLEEIQRKYKNRATQLLEQPNFMVKSRTRPEPSSPINSGKAKSTVRISTLGSKLVHIPRLSRGQARFSNVDNVSSDSTESGQHSISSVASVGFRHSKTLSPREPIEREIRKKIRENNVKHWTTKHIVHTEFNAEALTITIKTDRLGIFGFALKRYEHFPFRDWHLQQNEEQPNEIIFKLDTFHVRVILYINNLGIRGYVTKIVNEYVANPVKFLEIKEPISDYRELRRRFLEKNLNIFAEYDACYYIENGYFSEKHLASELHIYNVFAVHCKLLRFYRSDWNRLANRRDLILCMRNLKDWSDGTDVTVRVTPDNSTFVEVSEPCSLDLNEIKVAYHLTWRNIGTYSDLHQLITSMYPQATDVRNRDPKLIHYIRTLLAEVRPLSYS